MHSYLGFLWKRYRTYRTALFSLIDEFRFIAPGSDNEFGNLIWTISAP
jgi:hypothetical protein